MAGHTLIRAEHLYRYYGDYCAVQDASFECGRGEILGFLGLNGAGKSSTLKMLSGNLAPSAGRVLIGDADLARNPIGAQARLGYLPEAPPLYPDLTLDEYLRYVARLHRVAPPRVAGAVARAKERCGLVRCGRQLLGTLSKGYQQRAGIAQAIVHAPEVVLLDEPTVGLDPVQIREIRGLIRELGQDHAVMLSSHILPEIEAVCSRVLILHHGRVVFSESLQTLPQQTRGGLLVALRNPPRPEALAAIPGVTEVETVGAGRFHVRHEPTAAPADALVRRSIEQNWGLTELTPQRNPLEQVFVELTCADEEHPPPTTSPAFPG